MKINKRKSTIKEPDKWEFKKQENKAYIDKFKIENVIDVSHDKWMGLVFVGDNHLGNSGVDMEAMQRDAEFISSSSGLYAVLCGDQVDNFVNMKIVSAVINKNSSPKDEHYFLERYLQFFNGKVIVGISGNHEHWSKAMSGFDVFRDLYNHNQIVYGSDEFYINLTVGEQTYEILIRHKYRYNSSFNLTHSVKQMYRMYKQFDVGVLAHHHEYAVETTYIGDRQVALIRTGSYKVADVFGREIGWKPSVPIMPVVCFNPQKKQMITFCDLKSASDFINFKNGRKK